MASILIVDDDLDLADLVMDVLTHENHTVEHAQLGVEGWEKARANQYDLLIFDWDLPDLNGVNILQRYRAAGGNAPVLMLTGHTSASDKELALDLGADDYLPKPFDVIELRARVRALLRRTRVQEPSLQASAGSNKTLLERADLIGTSLAARYEFLDIVGEGSFAVVYKARHPQLDKLVAIKMLHKNEVNEKVVARFEQEARAISKLEHPNIAVVFDFGTTEKKQQFMVLELISGKGLDQIILEKGQLTIPEATDVCIQICNGMAHAHAAGVLHRDLKPSNLILKEVAGGSAVLKILDFGFAKFLDSSDNKAPSITDVGKAIGSPPYMSPEQIRGYELDQRSDVYSLACVLYELLTGHLPHSADDFVSVLVKHINEEPAPLGVVRHDLVFPDELEKIVVRAMAKDRNNRYQSMDQFKNALIQFKASKCAKEAAGPNWWQKLGKKLRG